MENREQELRKAQLTNVINELEHNEAFNILLEDSRQNIIVYDNNWHLIDVTTDEGRQKFTELRHAKLSELGVLSKIEDYKRELESINAEREREEEDY